jgi:DNA-binding MurR/RpiR family transcriptional regulator
MFRERITRNYQSLSPSFKKIADYMLTSHQRVAFMSASRLARLLGVDVATVTRFSQQIGYEGYTELIREIQETVLEEMRRARAPMSERMEAAEGQIARTLWWDWMNLEKTIQNISLEDADRAVAAIRAARRIFIVSEGAGAGLAVATANYLRVSKPYVDVLNHGAFDMAMVLKEMGPEDVVIGIGFTNYAFSATRALELARERGARTIGVIAQADCPIGATAEILFTCSATEQGYLPSLTGVSAILFALSYSWLISDHDAYHRDLVRFQEVYADLTEGTGRDDHTVVDDLIGRF